MKIQLELNIPSDGRMFLNYWDSANGNDLTCEINNGFAFVPDFVEAENATSISRFFETVALQVVESSLKNQSEELAKLEAIENKDGFDKSRIVGIKRWLEELEQIKSDLE